MGVAAAGGGSSPIDANIRLLARQREQLDAGEQEASGMRVISTLTLHIPARMRKRTGGHYWECPL